MVKNIFIIISMFLLLISWSKNSSLKDENERLSDLADEYYYALAQANENIEEANSVIEEAQGYAWSSYEDMGYALENMYTIDTVSGPW